MGLDRETIAQVLVSITAVALFIAGLVVLSVNYGTEVADGVIDISPSGGLPISYSRHGETHEWYRVSRRKRPG